MSSSFPWLTALIVVPLLGAVALWVRPCRHAPEPSRSASRLLELAARRRGAHGVRRRRRRRRPARSRCTAGSPRSGCPTRSASTAWACPRAHVGADRAAGGPGRLARAGQPHGGHRPAAPLPRARPAARGVHRRRVRRPGRVLLLRPVRGHAHPGLLHDRPVRRGPAAVRGREVPALLADRRPDHARRRHRPVPAGTGRTAGLPHGEPHGPRRWTRRPRSSCSARSSWRSPSRRRCSRCTPGCPTPRSRRPPGPRRCWSACWTRSARSGCSRCACRCSRTRPAGPRR